jgi:hypothetical protein
MKSNPTRVLKYQRDDVWPAGYYTHPANSFRTFKETIYIIYTYREREKEPGAGIA